MMGERKQDLLQLLTLSVSTRRGGECIGSRLWMEEILRCKTYFLVATLWEKLASPVECDLSVCCDYLQVLGQAQLELSGFVGLRWCFLTDFPFNIKGFVFLLQIPDVFP